MRQRWCIHGVSFASYCRACGGGNQNAPLVRAPADLAAPAAHPAAHQESATQQGPNPAVNDGAQARAETVPAVFADPEQPSAALTPAIIEQLRNGLFLGFTSLTDRDHYVNALCDMAIASLRSVEPFRTVPEQLGGWIVHSAGGEGPVVWAHCRTLDDVRRAIASMVWGDPKDADSEELDGYMNDFADPENWGGEGIDQGTATFWSVEFEIDGLGAIRLDPRAMLAAAPEAMRVNTGSGE